MTNSRVPRPTNDLSCELSEQLELLQSSCEIFDKGLEAEAKRIATSLRLLLKDGGPKSNTKSLLGQMGLKIDFVDTSYIAPKEIIYEGERERYTGRRRLYFLCLSRHYAPVFGGDPNQGVRTLPFKSWWAGEQILHARDGSGGFTREQIVLTVAETDGGAHVDETIPELYSKFTREELHGHFGFEKGEDGESKVTSWKAPHLVTIRQIAHEVLLSVTSEYKYCGRNLYPGHHIGGITITLKKATSTPKSSAT